MTLPVGVLQRRASADRHDVAVVGAGISGLVAAALLARGGASVVLVDAGRRPGGRQQTLLHQGFAVDLAPPLWEAEGLRETIEAAGGADISFAPISLRQDLRLVVMEGGAVRGDPHALPVPGAVPSPSTLDAIRELHGCPPRVFAALGGLGERLAGVPSMEWEERRGEKLSDWLASSGAEAPVAAAMLRTAALLGACDPGRASAAAMARRLRGIGVPDPSHLLVADNPVAGARGVVQALVDAFVAAGGEMRLGARVVGVEIERGRLRSLAVQREERPFLEEVLVGRAVFAIPGSEVAALLPATAGEALAAGRVGDRAATIGLAFGLRESTSGTGTTPALVRIVPPASRAGAAPVPGAPPGPITVVRATAFSPRVAPPGQALVLAHLVLAPERADPAEIRRVVLLVREAVRMLDRASEFLWERHWILPGADDPLGVPAAPRATESCPDIVFAGRGVAVAGSLATGVAASALAGRAAAQQVLGAG